MVVAAVVEAVRLVVVAAVAVTVVGTADALALSDGIARVVVKWQLVWSDREVTARVEGVEQHDGVSEALLAGVVKGCGATAEGAGLGAFFGPGAID